MELGLRRKLCLSKDIENYKIESRCWGSNPGFSQRHFRDFGKTTKAACFPALTAFAKIAEAISFDIRCVFLESILVILHQFLDLTKEISIYSVPKTEQKSFERGISRNRKIGNLETRRKRARGGRVGVRACQVSNVFIFKIKRIRGNNVFRYFLDLQ